MFLFTRRVRPVTWPRSNTRVCLGLEQLDPRVAPVDLFNSAADPSHILSAPLSDGVVTTSPSATGARSGRESAPVTPQQWSAYRDTRAVVAGSGSDSDPVTRATENTASTPRTAAASTASFTLTSDPTQVTGDAPIDITLGAVSLLASDATRWTSDTRSTSEVPATGNTLTSDPIQATSGSVSPTVAAATGNAFSVNAILTTGGTASSAGTPATGPARTPDDNGTDGTNAQNGPTITLTATQSGIGMYIFTGSVTANPTAVGLTVTFSGTPSMTGESTTVMSDSTYDIAIPVQTNGNDIGFVTATVTDAAGNTATAQVFISPSP